MNAISLSPLDLAVTASLVLVDALLSMVLKLRLHRQLLIAAARMVVQLTAIGFVLRAVFALQHPAVTLAIVLVMTLVAAREVSARPEQRFADHASLWLALIAVALATYLTVGLALITAVRPHPWYDPRYAIALVGIILGNALNAGSLSLDTLLTSARRDRAAVEAQLTLGADFWTAIAPSVREAVRRGMLPIVNQMSAAGLVTLPGIMTGQILAGLDPLEAVKYQILLMFLLAGAGGVCALTVAYLAAWRLTDERERLRLDRLISR